jgi:predicted RNA binding protein YcfA (HicA-like mRNA interferase family)
VAKHEKTLLQVLRGSSDSNISFDELCSLLRHLGFDERIRGSHHIFTKGDVEEIINIQPKGAKAKAYQVKQVRGVMLRYKLAGESNE